MDYTQKIKPIKESANREVSGGVTLFTTNSPLMGIFSMKICTRCGVNKPLSEYYVRRDRECGYMSACKKCNIKSIQHKQCTIDGMITQVYSRHGRSSKKRNHPPPAYSRDWLYERAISSNVFLRLYNEWLFSGRKKDLIPSFDRIDSNKPYTKDNLQIVTFRQNLLNSCEEIRSGSHQVRQKRTAVIYDDDGRLFGVFPSTAAAARATNNTQGNVSSCCTGKNWVMKGYRFMFEEDYNG